jgi:hypothetical protein
VAGALPGSLTAPTAVSTATALATALRSAAGDLDQLAAALSAAARNYTVVESTTATGIARAGRRPT